MWIVESASCWYLDTATHPKVLQGQALPGQNAGLQFALAAGGLDHLEAKERARGADLKAGSPWLF